MVAPIDRPIFYGVFMRIASLGLSLWFVVVFQALITSFVLWKVWEWILPKADYRWFLVALVPLAYLTSLGWYTSQLMPDIFTALGILSGLLLLARNDLTLKEKAVLSLVLVLAVLVHNSNVPIILGTMLLTWIWQRRNKQRSNTLLVTSLVIGAITLALIVNLSLTGSARISRGGHVFLMGKMLDSGVLKSYLDDHCEAKTLKLCAYKDSLPATNRELLWEANSPVQALGGWEGCEEEFKNTFFGILTSPKHLLLYFRSCVTSTGTQLFQNDLGSGLVSNWYRSPGSPPASQIHKHFFTEYNDYQLSRQNGNLWGQELEIGWIRVTNRLLLMFSAVFMLSLVLIPSLRRNLENSARTSAFTCLSLLFINALVVASLANVYDRLQARVSWLLIFISLALLLRYGSQLFDIIRELWRQNQPRSDESS